MEDVTALRRLRKATGMTIRQMASKLGVKEDRYRKWETDSVSRFMCDGLRELTRGLTRATQKAPPDASGGATRPPRCSGAIGTSIAPPAGADGAQELAH